MALPTNQKWTGATGEDVVDSVLAGGGKVYAGLGTNPAITVKIDPANMTTLAEFNTGVMGNEQALALAFDGTNLYVATYRAVG